MGVASPKGPLPRAVYWRRRVVLLALVAATVLFVQRVFFAAEGPGDERADEAASTSESSRTSAQDSATGGEANGSGKADPSQRADTSQRRDAAAASGANQHRKNQRQGTRDKAARRQGAEPVQTSLAAPTGECDPADIVVKPDVADAHSYDAVPMRVGVSTTAKPCTFEFSAQSVVIQITSGDDLIWESAACPSSVPDQPVVVRPGWLTYVTVDWNGRRATENCSDGNAHAQPGYYWAEAAALGGEAARGQFQLTEPPPPPKDEKGDDKDRSRQDGRDNGGDADGGRDGGNGGERDAQSDGGRSDGDQSSGGQSDGDQSDGGQSGERSSGSSDDSTSGDGENSDEPVNARREG